MKTASDSPTPAPNRRTYRHASARMIGSAFVLLWCTGYPAGKIALGHSAPFTLLGMRFGAAGLLYAALAVSAHASWPRGRIAWHSAMVGALSLALQFGGVYLGIALGANVGIAALMIGTMPIATALLSLLFGEPVRGQQWFGFAFGFAGVALVVGDRLDPGTAGIGAYVALLIGLLGISAGTLYQKRYGSDVDLRAGLTLQNLSATLLLLPLALFEGFRMDASPALFASLSWLILINSMGGFALLFLLLRRGAATEVATLFFLMPPVAATMNFLVLGENLSAFKLAGFALAAFGVYLATRHDKTLVSAQCET